MSGDVWLGGSANPLPLDGGDAAWRIETGHANLFLIEDTGLRRHLLRLETGDAMLSVVSDARVVAVGSLDSRFVRIDPAMVTPEALTRWLDGLGGLVREVQGSWHDRLVEPGSMAVDAGERLRLGQAGIGWIHLTGGSAWLRGTVPLPADRWVMMPPHARVEVRAAGTAMVSHDLPAAADTLDAATALAGAVLTTIAAAAATDASAEAQRRALAGRRSDDLLADGLAMLIGESGGRRYADGTGTLAIALDRVLDAAGYSGVRPDLRDAQDESADLDAILAASAIRHRPVLLRPGWWKTDGLPLLVRLDAGGWAALLPDRGKWRLVGRDIDARVDRDVADRVAADAVQLYPALEPRAMRFRDLLPLATRGIGRDGLRLVFAGIGGAAAALAVPFASQTLFDEVVPLGDAGGLVQILAALFAVAVALAAFELVKAFALMRIEARADAGLQAAVFDRLLRLPVAFFKRYNAGDLAQRTLGFQAAREQLSAATLAGALSVVFALSNLVVMLSIDARLTLVAVPATAAIAAINYLIARARLRQERSLAGAKGVTTGFTLQLLVGIAKLKTAAAEPRGLAQWAAKMAVERRAIAGSLRVGAIGQVTGAVLPGTATMLIFLAVAYFAEQDLTAAAKATPGASAAAEAMTTGGFVAFAAAFGQLSAALTASVAGITQAIGAAPLLERSRPLLETVPEIAAHREPVEHLAGAIDIRGATFRYAPTAPPALDGLDLSIAPGEFVAIVGPSGSGKSTIMRLLLGFERAERGEIFYDGTALDRLDVATLRRNIGVVLQHGKVTSGSILENIIGSADLGLDDAWAAARLVNLAADIEAMPMGMHTVLTDGGRTLSGGQRQRILLARALVRRPGLLLLDEATSALDNRTQAVVTETLATLDMTRIVIAHRLSTIRKVDRVFVLERGRLVEAGGYDELIEQGGAFAAMARRQLL